MLRGAIRSASAIVGTAVFRIVESSDSMKNATATSHGSSSFADSIGGGRSCGANRGDELGSGEAGRVQDGGVERLHEERDRDKPWQQQLCGFDRGGALMCR